MMSLMVGSCNGVSQGDQLRDGSSSSFPGRGPLQRVSPPPLPPPSPNQKAPVRPLWPHKGRSGTFLPKAIGSEQPGMHHLVSSNDHLCAALQELPSEGNHSQDDIAAGIINEKYRLAVGLS